jgi:hypothetical protein
MEFLTGTGVNSTAPSGSGASGRVSWRLGRQDGNRSLQLLRDLRCMDHGAKRDAPSRKGPGQLGALLADSDAYLQDDCHRRLPFGHLNGSTFSWTGAICQLSPNTRPASREDGTPQGFAQRLHRRPTSPYPALVTRAGSKRARRSFRQP